MQQELKMDQYILVGRLLDKRGFLGEYGLEECLFNSFVFCYLSLKRNQPPKPKQFSAEKQCILG